MMKHAREILQALALQRIDSVCVCICVSEYVSDPGGSTSVSVCAYVCVYVCVRASSTPLATHILQVLCESSG